jgi:hypothetical protein
MSIGEMAIIVLLSDKVVRDVFKEILRNRSEVFKDLLTSTEKTFDAPVGAGRREIEFAVSKLKEADLIKERTAPIEDFNSYYVTSHGLNAERQLRVIDSHAP